MDRQKLIFIGVAVLAGLAILGWLIYESIKPLPGEKIVEDCGNDIDFSKLEVKDTEDKCRVHVGEGTAVNYSTNPPVFGPHYAEWTKAGVFDAPLDDRNTTHSLEHGYVIMYYRCDSAKQIATDSSSPQSDLECNQGKSQLEAIFNKKGKTKKIVAPRINLETNFALTAWGYLDKFDPSTSSGLSVSDIERIERFIDAHLNNGPERTMEP